MGDVWIGSKPPLRLESCDELQAKTALGTWFPVPVVEAEKPEHPDALEAREHNEAIREAVHKAVAGGGGPSVSRRREPLAWAAARMRILDVTAKDVRDAQGGHPDTSCPASRNAS
jgi:hypothetical protein